jgi:DNA-binding response OmpR family regulator
MDDSQNFQAAIPDDTGSESPTLKHVPRVLIVEDTIELAEIIRAAIRHLNVLTFHEARGLSALRAYYDVRPDLVLLDIGLPDMSGWKLLDSIKESQTEGRRPVVVVITAYGDPANRLMGKLQGVDSYLVKPFTLDEVRAIVQRVVNQIAESKSADGSHTE